MRLRREATASQLGSTAHSQPREAEAGGWLQSRSKLCVGDIEVPSQEQKQAAEWPNQISSEQNNIEQKDTGTALERYIRQFTALSTSGKEGRGRGGAFSLTSSLLLCPMPHHEEKCFHKLSKSQMSS